MNPITQRAMRTAWFRHDRLGLFIHWGLYSAAARGGLMACRDYLKTGEYERFFNSFDPVDFNPRALLHAAKEAGMRYAVMTAKHHDGFCLFDSALTDYKATNTRAGRDLIDEYIAACRAEGLKVGLFYSLLDWHHPDYPCYGDAYHPLRDDPAEKGNPRNFDRYLDYMHGQIRELCTNYGKIDILWFDFSYGEMSGEKWRATELVQMIRKLQPGIIIDNRLEDSDVAQGGILSRTPAPYAGDFACPEQLIPPRGLTDEDGNAVPWEACVTLNNHFVYHAQDNEWKSPRLLIRKLVECVSKNGNLLINIGPDARGNVPQPSLDILAEIGSWIRKNGDSIYGCTSSSLPKPEWGWYTQGGQRLYAHIFDGSIGPLPMSGLSDKVASMRILADGSDIPVRQMKAAAPYGDFLFVNFGSDPTATYPLPDDRDTVIELVLKSNVIL